MTVKENRVEVIVNLTSLEDKEAYYEEEEDEDWPTGGKDVGDGLKVELLNKGKEGLILKRYSDRYLFWNFIKTNLLSSFAGNCACFTEAFT